MINLVTGKMRAWTVRPSVDPQSLSLSADGRLLGLVGDPKKAQSSASAWVLPTGSAPGPLSSAGVKRPWHAAASADGFMTEGLGSRMSIDGSGRYAIVYFYHRQALDMKRLDLATGRVVTLPVAANNDPFAIAW
ncbi:MAG: hypothetical protein ACLPUO_14025 [Streptosporangiaceae bacterium]